MDSSSHTIEPAGPEVGAGVHQYDAFARSWLRTMYTLDTPLGRKQGERRKWACVPKSQLGSRRGSVNLSSPGSHDKLS